MVLIGGQKYVNLFVQK